MQPGQFNRMIDRMAAFPGAVSALLQGVPDSDARQKPPGGAWSIVEIVNHLADEESEDFRTRVRMTLDDPSQLWPRIDSEGVVIERRHGEKGLAESLERFAEERAESVNWLRSLNDPDWTKTYNHPQIGELRAGDVMLSWSAHDSLHLRQIAKRLFELAQRDGDGFSAAYAGDW